MSEAPETEAPEADAPEAETPALPDDVLTLMEAADRYAVARAKLPPPDCLFRGPNDAKNFQAYTVALFALERAAMAHGGRAVRQ